MLWNAKSVRKGRAGTIGLQRRTQTDKAVFVTTGIHFCWEGTMCKASVPYSTILYCTVPPLKTPINFQSFSQPRLCDVWVGEAFTFFQLVFVLPCCAFLRHSTADSYKHPPCTYSLKRRLWILVMAFEAIGLPMPELAGEPWDTGVMLYGEFWLAGEREASLGTLRPLSVDRKNNKKNISWTK